MANSHYITETDVSDIGLLYRVEADHGLSTLRRATKQNHQRPFSAPKLKRVLRSSPESVESWLYGLVATIEE